MKKRKFFVISLFFVVFLLSGCIFSLYKSRISGSISPFVGSVVEDKQSVLAIEPSTSSIEFEHHVSGEYIVKFNDWLDRNKASSLFMSVGMEKSSIQKALSFRGSKTNYFLIKASEENIEKLKRLPEVEFVEPNYLFFSQAEVTPDDPYYPEQWHYSLINLPAAWSITRGSSLTVVAVIDTGVRFDHPDLQGVFYDVGYDFVDDDPDPTDPGMSYDGKIISHGTHVAGTIAALTNNNQGVSGVCWGGNGVRILPIRVLDDSGIGTSFDVARGIVYAVEHGAKVLNMSLGSPSDSSIIRDAIKYAYDNDVVVVCAAGNDNGSLRYPAKYPETIAVGAVRLDKERAWYSNYGPELDVVAPGGDLGVDQNGDGNPDGVLSTCWISNDGELYEFLQGTSMAAPHVSGIVALLMSKGYTGVETIRKILRYTAEDLGEPGFDNYYGAGLVDAYRALTYDTGYEPFIVWTVDAVTGVIDSITSADEGGNFLLTEVKARSVYVYAWRDVDHNMYLTSGDLYGYYGYSGGNPKDGTPTAITVEPGETITVEFQFSPIITDRLKPVFEGSLLQKVLEIKEAAVEEYYNKLERK